MSSDTPFGDDVYESGDAVDDAEFLDPIENLTGEDADEEMETGYSPPEREPYDLRHAHTPREEREGESLDEHLAEEEPDVSEETVPYDEADPRAGRLVAPDEGFIEDREADEVAEDVGPAGYASSAEEAAVHVIDEDRLDEE